MPTARPASSRSLALCRAARRQRLVPVRLRVRERVRCALRSAASRDRAADRAVRAEALRAHPARPALSGARGLRLCRRAGRDRVPRRRAARGRRVDDLVLHLAVPQARRQVHGADLPEPFVHAQRRRRHHGLRAAAARDRAPRDDRRRPHLLRRSRVPRRVRPRAVRAGQPRVRLRPHPRIGRRDDRRDPCRNHPIAPLAQTAKPGRTWKVEADTGRKSAGAMGVQQPNNAGGVGDASGMVMFDLIVGKPQYEQRSNERLLRETNASPAALRERASLAWRTRTPDRHARAHQRHRRAEPARHQGLPGAGRLRAAAPRRERHVAARGVRHLQRVEPARPRRRRFSDRRKWSFLPLNGRPRYMVCNCDEAEPGTFKDHMLLEETPHQIIEGILIARTRSAATTRTSTSAASSRRLRDHARRRAAGARRRLHRHERRPQRQ